MAQVRRVGFRKYKGKDYLHLDINNCTVEEFEQLLKDSGKLIRRQPLRSVLSLASGGEGTPIFTNRDMFVEYLTLNGPHMKASAVSGLPLMKSQMFSAVVAASGRELKLTETEEEALEWLVGQ